MYPLTPIPSEHWYGLWTDDKGCAYIGKGIYRIKKEKFNKMFAGLKPGDERIHLCDNPPCIHPLHVRGGTTLENVQDCISKGRAHWQK